MRKSTLDSDYETGGLSEYPVALDDRDTLYEVKNNAETVLTQGVSYSGKYFVVNDTSTFPAKGLINVGTELVYYGTKTGDSSGGTFRDLVRGFAGSRRNAWPTGTVVANSVMAEPHNALKDAIINIERNIGLEEEPDTTSLNGILKSLETRYLSPKPIFRASPITGPAPLTVKFQNFSTGNSIRYLWDFGDGGTSVDMAPTHTYLEEGSYTVKLNMISSLGAQGIATKTDYIIVDNSITEDFYYVTPLVGTTATTFNFVDQTLGDVISRYWIFDDGESIKQLDPDIHAETHVYSEAGTYNTALVVVFADQTLRRYVFDPIVVS
jgi:PKD repeat protein